MLLKPHAFALRRRCRLETLEPRLAPAGLAGGLAFSGSLDAPPEFSPADGEVVETSFEQVGLADSQTANEGDRTASLTGRVLHEGPLVWEENGTLLEVELDPATGEPDGDSLGGMVLQLRWADDGAHVRAEQAAAGHYSGPFVEVVTDAAGGYTFTGLPSGEFLVVRVHPLVIIDGLDPPPDPTEPTETEAPIDGLAAQAAQEFVLAAISRTVALKAGGASDAGRFDGIRNETALAGSRNGEAHSQASTFESGDPLNTFSPSLDSAPRVSRLAWENPGTSPLAMNRIAESPTGDFWAGLSDSELLAAGTPLEEDWLEAFAELGEAEVGNTDDWLATADAANFTEAAASEAMLFFGATEAAVIEKWSGLSADLDGDGIDDVQVRHDGFWVIVAARPPLPNAASRHDSSGEIAPAGPGNE